jgi:glycosyltransferase involved in cell wall biosynthesis
VKVMFNVTCFRTDKPTGIERFALQIAREYYRIDPSAIIVTKGPIAEISTAVISKLLATFNSIFKNNGYLVRALWDQTFLRFIVARHKPDIVFFPIQDGMFYPPAKQVVTVHDLHYLHFTESMPDCNCEINCLRAFLYRRKMPHILARSAAIVAISESTKKDIVERFGVPAEKIHVIYNGYDESRFRPLQDIEPVLQRYGLRKETYLLFVSSVLPHKNIPRLIKAFARLEFDTKLVLAGGCKDARCLTEIMETAKALGVGPERLSYLEYVPDEDLAYLYNGAIAFVLPSLHEGFGVPLVEAMACGTPVVTSNCSAMPEVAGEAALYVDPLDIESIADGMRMVLASEKVRMDLRSSALEQAKRFRWAASAEKLYDVFKMIN